jgi:flagellar protein FliO/FliZ
MRPAFRRIFHWSVAAGTLWLTSPPRVLAADSRTVDEMFKNKNGVPGEAPTAPVVGTGDGSIIWSLLQLIFALGIIIAIIYLLIRLLSSRSQRMQGAGIHLLGVKMLGNNRSVQMIAVGEKVYLIGVGEDITLLDTVTDPDLIQELRDANEHSAVSGPAGWQTLLKKLGIKTQAETAASEEISIDDLSFDATLREKLNSLKEKRKQSVDDWQQEGRKQ